MINFPFKNYAEFAEIFGTPNKRKNALLLSCLKAHRALINTYSPRHYYARQLDVNYYIAVANSIINNLGFSYKNHFKVLNYWLGSNDYKLSFGGFCQDGDPNSIRYARIDNGKVYKMKAGKFFRKCLVDTVGDIIPAALANYLCELFVNSWIAEASHNNYTLHLGSSLEDFEYIYNSDHQVGNFHSCMNDEENFYFYSHIQARAAWIENKDNEIVARCIIFDNVHNMRTGETLQLAERQYCDNDLGKQILIAKLIEAKEIDGYKKFGAGCSEATAFVRNNGDDLTDHLYIDAWLDADTEISYQDSFKFFAYKEGRIYNFVPSAKYLDLAVTGGRLETNFDEYHERYCFCTETCYYHGSWIEVDADDLEDFIKIEGDFYHYDDVSYCEECQESYISDNGVYSELLDECFCSEMCKESAEECYKAENWVKNCLNKGELIDPDDLDTVKIMKNGRIQFTTSDDITPDYEYNADGDYYMQFGEAAAARIQSHLDFA